MRLDALLLAVCLLIELAQAIKGGPPHKHTHKKKSCKKHHQHHQKYAVEDQDNFNLNIQLSKAKGDAVTEGGYVLRQTGFGVVAKLLLSGTYVKCNASESLQCHDKLKDCPPLTCATKSEYDNRLKVDHKCHEPIKCTMNLGCDCDNSRGYFRQDNNSPTCIKCNTVVPKQEQNKK